MNILIVTDSFPPKSNSAAKQLNDLAAELVRQGHTVYVVTAASNSSLSHPVTEEIAILAIHPIFLNFDGRIIRAIREAWLPFQLISGFRRSSFATISYDLVVWYSPTIFLGPFISYLKRSQKSCFYLILRDIFPDWAFDLGLIKNKFMYHFLKRIANYQYLLADVIGVQTRGNLPYLAHLPNKGWRGRLEVLPNWLNPPRPTEFLGVSDLDKLKGRRLFIYAGNLGVAQSIDKLVDHVGQMNHRSDIGFIIVGQGDLRCKIKQRIERRKLENILLLSEVEEGVLDSIFEKCCGGIVMLSDKHRTHNIPGKFIRYIHFGLPVIALVNNGNDIIDVISSNNIGVVCAPALRGDFMRSVDRLLAMVTNDPEIGTRCKRVACELYSTEKVAEQILSAVK